MSPTQHEHDLIHGSSKLLVETMVRIMSPTQKLLVETMSEDPMRQDYRELDDDEKLKMRQIKIAGLHFWDLCEEIGSSRELSLAKTKIEEAVMWAIKHVTK